MSDTADVDAAIPMPPGVEALPREARGLPIPAHVERRPGRPVRLQEMDPKRLVLLTAARRCTICAWSIREDELCWYFSWPPAIEANRRSGWTIWDPAIEGAGHKECMCYSACVCPGLATAQTLRRGAQLAGGQVVAPKGFARGPMTLVGAPEARLRFNPKGAEVVVGGGVPTIVEFDDGPDLLPGLQTALTGDPRTPSAADADFVTRIASDNEQSIFTWSTQVGIEAGCRQGFPFAPPGGRNDPCVCESGRKLKHCCGPRAQDALAEARRQPLVW